MVEMEVEWWKWRWNGGNGGGIRNCEQSDETKKGGIGNKAIRQRRDSEEEGGAAR